MTPDIYKIFVVNHNRYSYKLTSAACSCMKRNRGSTITMPCSRPHREPLLELLLQGSIFCLCHLLCFKYFHGYICSSPNKEAFIETTSKASLKNKTIVQNIYNGILFSYKKEGNSALCDNIDGS